MKGTVPRRIRGLRSHLAVLLAMTMLLTFSTVGAVILLWRLPEIERQARAALASEVDALGVRLDLQLGAYGSRLELVARLIPGLPHDQVSALMRHAARSSQLLRALYLVSPDGRVLALGLAQPEPSGGADLLGRDLSADALFRAARAQPGIVWGGRHRSAVSGADVVGLALRDDAGRVLFGEVSRATVLAAVEAASGHRRSLVWVIDRDGDVLADTSLGPGVQRRGPSSPSVLRALREGAPAAPALHFKAGAFHAAALHVPSLDWWLVARSPAGWHAPQVRRVLLLVLATLGSGLLLGLLVAPFWARRLARPLQEIVEWVTRTTRGRTGDASPSLGPVSEFNRLSAHLQAMVATLRERELKFLSIFNAAPVPMAVVDVGNASRILDVNDAWCRDLGRRRADVLGRTSQDIGLWSSQQREDMLQRAVGDTITGEAEVLCGDGRPVLMQVFGQHVRLASQQLLVWALVDNGPLRRAESALRNLNRQLEERVAQRSEALARSNADLSQALEQLKETRSGLVQAEKMAALGALVAGVAHELNTPLGNGVLAVSAMEAATRQFQAAMRAGLRRADLSAWLEQIAEGCDIAGRNLRRAAELMQSFKQVAVDQTSAQRRRFELHEVVHEMVVSLRPSFACTPYRIEVEVPQRGLALDSYPGALGQVVGNLVQNAVLHGFDGRAHGTVRITGERAVDGWIVLRVSDDGQGIAAELVGRVFEPFMTTKMGRGGTGLGLHISYNAVTNLLGGTLTVDSSEGQGTCFELRLPPQAPGICAEAAAPAASALRA